MMPGRIPRQFLILYALIISLLASCSGTSVDTTVSTTSSVPNGVVVVANEHSFVPAVLTLDGVRTVLLRNEGGLAHTWTVLAEPVESEEEIAAAPVLAEGQVEVGQTASIDLVSTTPGRYQVVCAIPGHFSAGMKGEVVIGEG
jgi:plastocyanin